MTNVAKQRLLLAISLAAMLAAVAIPRIPQDPAYHDFADQNPLGVIPNAQNVLTNLIFLWIGVEGLYRLLRQGSLRIVTGLLPAYGSFFAALLLIAAGSAYYHWDPDNASLAWDRLGISLAFMSLFTVILGERVSLGAARRLFPLLLLAAAASILYWYLSELAGSGDLRPYLLLQLLPLVLVPMILWGFDAPGSRTSDLWWLLTWYLLAKLCEVYDHEIYDSLGVISGHSLKHVFAGIGGLVWLRHLRRRVIFKS